MPSCKINGCSSQFSKISDISLFSVPFSQPTRDDWIKAIEKVQPFDYYVQKFYICSIHFEEHDLKTSGTRKTVKPGKIPSIFPLKSDGYPGNIGGMDMNQNETTDMNMNYGTKRNIHIDIIPQSNGYLDALGDLCEIDVSDNAATDMNMQSSEPMFSEISIPRTKYKELIDKTVELEKLKALNLRLVHVLKDKSTQIKELKKKLDDKIKSTGLDTDTNTLQGDCMESKQLEILNCLQHGNSFKKYSPDVRLFCFTLHYYSPKAYEYVRSTFNLNIPAPRTLRYWYSSIDGSPGFTKCSLDALEKRAAKYKVDTGDDLAVGIIFDEMFMRRQSQWDNSQKQFLGHVAVGEPKEYVNFSPLSKEVLLLMVSSINSDFKIPIGYFLSAGMGGDEKASIIDEALFKLKATGVKVASITCDGAHANISALKKLGAQYNKEKPYFPNPHDIEYNVYLFLDPPHMLKLVRNCLGRKDVLYCNDEKIQWTYIKDLILLQISSGINLANKLTKTHLEYKSKIMNVGIAAQTISDSTASSIEFLDQVIKHKAFANSAATVKYLRTFRNLFDIMNTKLKHINDKYKRPISCSNVVEIEEYFKFAKDYIKSLKVIQKGKEIALLQSESRTPYFGFYHNMTSCLGLYKDYVKNSKVDELFMFSISQDHVESFFGCVRRMNGLNDNPNAQQFSAAYRKLLVHNEITSSAKSNCTNDITEILEISSKREKKIVSTNGADIRILEEIYENGEVPNPSQSGINDEFKEGGEDEISLQEHSKAYLASLVEAQVIQRIKNRKKKGCILCINVFSENEITTDKFIDFLSTKQTILEPCKSTLDLITTVDVMLENYNSVNASFESTLTHILEKIDLTGFYASSEFGDIHDHKNDFVKLIIEVFFDIKSMRLCKLMTRLSQNKLLRHTHLKELHRVGQ